MNARREIAFIPPQLSIMSFFLRPAVQLTVLRIAFVRRRFPVWLMPNGRFGDS